jgi:hypothetical protein
MEETVFPAVIAVEPIKPRQLRHREVISQLVYHSKTVAQIAEELGFSEPGLHRIIRSPLFQVELQKELLIKQRMERDSVLQSIATEGAEKLREAVTTGKLTFHVVDKDGKETVTEKVLDGREIIAIAHDALDRTGHKPISKTVEAHVDLGTMILQAHKEAEQEAGADCLDIVPEKPTE